VTSSAAAAEDLGPFGLVEGEPDQVAERRPAAGAPEEGGDQADIQGAGAVRRRVHDVTVLSLIVLTQIAWIAALAYGITLLV
jgi:hypothetical protein